jgi:hypothetical protein
MDPIKLAGIRDWPSPTTVKQTRSFLGFGNYYRRFISGFAEIARPLHELTKKDKIWNWTNECQTTFETLKERFSTAPVLTMPDTTKPFILETDASKWAIGATLLQKQDNGQLHPYGYLSHALTQTERNWQIYDRELYAIIYALDEWKYLLTLSSNDDFIKGIIKCLKERLTPPLRTALSDWTLDDGIILFKNKVFVPNNRDIR